jgi:type VI secretion system protein ImpL
VVTAFERSLANKYPFNPNGHDAALADLADFYRPGKGTVWSFYDSTLQSDMPKEGSQFVFAKRLGSVASTIYRPQVLQFLNRTQDISSALFAPGANEVGIQFSIHVQPSPKFAAINFTVDGQSIEYKNGPEEWHSLKWPGEGKTLGASLKVRTPKGVTEVIEQEGEWGFFRVLEAGKAQAASGSRVFTVVWKIQSLDVDVAIDFRPARSETPFFGVPRAGQRVEMLHPFRGQNIAPPRNIGKSGAACTG